MARHVAIVGSAALAWVRRGKRVVLERGSVSRGSPGGLAEGRALSRQGDPVRLRSTVGRIMGRTSRTVFCDTRPVGLQRSTVTGPRIIRGWVTGGARTVLAD